MITKSSSVSNLLFCKKKPFKEKSKLSFALKFLEQSNIQFVKNRSHGKLPKSILFTTIVMYKKYGENH